MTKKDFELIARAINDARRTHNIRGEDGFTIGVATVAHVVANALTKTHPKFQRAKFLEACGFAETTTD